MRPLPLPAFLAAALAAAALGCGRSDAYAPRQPCVPQVLDSETWCRQRGWGCGQEAASDGCGGTYQVSCTCPGGERCGAGGVPHACGAPLCAPSGFCWENPLPQGNALEKVRGSSPSDVWAVGRHGTVLHFDGVRWSRGGDFPGQDVPALWSHDRDDAWVGTASTTWSGGAARKSGGRFHWDGSSWKAAGEGYTRALGGGAGQIWSAVASDGGDLLFRWTGSGWEQARAGALDEVFALGASGSDAWASTFGGVLHRWDGKDWSLEETGAAMRALWLDPSGAGFTVGDGGALFERRAGQRWVAGASGTSEPLRDVWGLSASQAWAVGARGTLLRRDADTWTAIGSGLTTDLSSVWASGPGIGWIASAAGALHRLDAPGANPPTSVATLRAVAQIGSGLLWAIGDDGTLLRRWSGVWSRAASPTKARLRALWVSGDRAWAVGDRGTLLYWSGIAWSVEDAGTRADLLDVWGSSPSDVWAVGADGALPELLHWNGQAWSRLPAPGSDPLVAIWGSARNDVFASGTQRTYRFDGASWAIADLPGYSRVWGTSASEVWAITNTSVEAGFSTLEPLRSSGVAKQLAGGVVLGLCGRSGDTWAVGTGPTLHWDGQTWTTLDEGTSRALHACWVGADGDVWAVGESGAILMLDRPGRP